MSQGTALLYATLGEIVGERAGIINLGLEGRLLVSASTGFAVTSLTGNPYLGVLAAVFAGGLMNMILGYLVVNRKANQLASGLALMFFGFGLSALIGKEFVGAKIVGLPKAGPARVLRPAEALRITPALRPPHIPRRAGRGRHLVVALPHTVGVGRESSRRKP